MFARIVECQAKAGRAEELDLRIKREIVPVLQKQPGFVDFIALTERTMPNKFLCISLWSSREDALQYHRRHYDSMTNMLQPLIEFLPTLKAFEVGVSTAHQVPDTKVA